MTYVNDVREFMLAAGQPVRAEPTNVEKLEEVLRRSENDFFAPISADIHEYAEWLDEAGVKAPDNA